MPDRFVRIQEMISKSGKLGVEDFKRIQADDYVLLAEDWVPIMTNLLSKKELSEKEEKALSALKNWDLVAKSEGIAPTIFHATVNFMIKNTFRKKMGVELYDQYLKNKYIVFNTLRNLISLGKSPWLDDPETPQEEGIDELITKSFRESVAYLDKKMGPDIKDWIWGKLHTLTLYHPFGRSSRLMGFFMNIGPFPMGGSIATVNPQPYRLSKPWEVYHGASLRYIIDFSERKNSLRVIPAGISGNFMSPHYDDQIELWRTVRYRPFVLDRETVLKDARYILKMLPG